MTERKHPHPLVIITAAAFLVAFLGLVLVSGLGDVVATVATVTTDATVATPDERWYLEDCDREVSRLLNELDDCYGGPVYRCCCEENQDGDVGKLPE